MDQSPTPKTEPFTRIVVGLDASKASLTSLEWAGHLARGLDLELNGLYVEDINLIHLAGFRFAREFAPALRSERPLNDRGMSAHLRAQADRARQAIEQLPVSAKVRCTFRVARGDVGAVLVASARGTDLIVVGARGRGALARGLASCTHRLLTLADGPVLFVPHQPNTWGPVVCLYDGTSSADRALRLAARLAMVDHKALDLFLLGPPALRMTVESRVMAILNDYPELRVQVVGPSPAVELHTLAVRPGRVLVLPATHPWVSDTHLERWTASERVPVVVAR